MSRALIIVGLAGDSEHQSSFRATALRWREWLSGPLGFPADQVRVLSGGLDGLRMDETPTTRESMALEVESVRKVSKPGDRLWVFVIGHANFEDGHVFFHLPGPDLRDDEFGPLFQGIAAQEQVFWLTNPGSGRFIPALSSVGRILIAATQSDGETNETEFPHALVDVSRMPMFKLDTDQDHRVSVRELFDATVEAVAARFAIDKRIATEHAQLDDNGDRLGTELPPLPSSIPSADGALAMKTFWPATGSASSKTPARSNHEPR